MDVICRQAPLTQSYRIARVSTTGVISNGAVCKLRWPRSPDVQYCWHEQRAVGSHRHILALNTLQTCTTVPNNNSPTGIYIGLCLITFVCAGCKHANVPARALPTSRGPKLTSTLAIARRARSSARAQEARDSLKYILGGYDCFQAFASRISYSGRRPLVSQCSHTPVSSVYDYFP